MPLIANESRGPGTMTGLKPQGEDQPAKGEKVRPEICTVLRTALHAMASDFGSLTPRIATAAGPAGGSGEGLTPGEAGPRTWAVV
jgi:hypothetical protein